MSDTDLPSKVYVLRPRKVSVSKKLDGFLEQAGLASAIISNPYSDTRPSSDGINAMICADCGQIEYLTRDYCRCGHYLTGQLEDEYLAWEQEILNKHTHLSEQVNTALRPLRILYGLAIPFLLIPLLSLLFWSDSFSLSALLWWSPAMLLAGAGVFAENHVIRPLKESACFVKTYTFEDFLDQRHSASKGLA